MYTYDANGNRATKTTAYGTITYSYDEENRLLKTCGVSGDGVEYRYDRNGNVLSQTGSLTQSVYEYNHQNRMVRSLVIDDEARTNGTAMMSLGEGRWYKTTMPPPCVPCTMDWVLMW